MIDYNELELQAQTYVTNLKAKVLANVQSPLDDIMVELEESRTEVYSTYDPNNCTWNWLDNDNTCLHYGDIKEHEAWIDDNVETHYELDRPS